MDTKNCYNCGGAFTLPETPAAGWMTGDAKSIFCSDCYTGWLADRDQKYAKHRAAMRADCAKKGHVTIPGVTLAEMSMRFKYCPRCGDEYIKGDMTNIR